jgi:hypothetical protein
MTGIQSDWTGAYLNVVSVENKSLNNMRRRKEKKRKENEEYFGLI